MLPSSAEAGPDLTRFWRKTISCRVCPTLAPYRKFPRDRHGTARYRLMMVGEAPGRVSLDNGRPFSNPRNLTIRRAFARAVAPMTWELEDLFYLTDVVKCWPAAATGANRSPSAKEIRTCSELHLRRELALVKPRLVVTFGAVASRAALGQSVKLAAVHGNFQTGVMGVRVLSFMHPSTANLAGLRRVDIRSPAEYEDYLARVLRATLSEHVPMAD